MNKKYTISGLVGMLLIALTPSAYAVEAFDENTILLAGASGGFVGKKTPNSLSDADFLFEEPKKSATPSRKASSTDFSPETPSSAPVQRRRAPKAPQYNVNEYRDNSDIKECIGDDWNFYQCDDLSGDEAREEKRFNQQLQRILRN